MKLNRVVAFLSLVFLVAACGKEDSKQNPPGLTYPNLTQISVVASQPVMANSIARLSNAAKLGVHSNVYRTANASDNTHFSILFYHVPSIDKNRAHIAQDAKQIAMRVDFNAADGKLTHIFSLNEKVKATAVIGTAKLNGNLITIESLNFGHSHLRKFLSIPDKSVFQKEQSDLRQEVAAVSEKHKALFELEQQNELLEEQISSLKKSGNNSPIDIQKLEKMTQEIQGIRKGISLQIAEITKGDNAIREKVARLQMLQIIIQESN